MCVSMCECAHIYHQNNTNNNLRTKIKKREEQWRKNIFKQPSLENSRPKNSFILCQILPLCDYFKMGTEKISKDKKSLNFINLNKNHRKSIEFFLINGQLAASKYTVSGILWSEVLMLSMLWMSQGSDKKVPGFNNKHTVVSIQRFCFCFWGLVFFFF